MIQVSCLILVIKELKGCLFLLVIILTMIESNNSHQKYLLPKVKIENWNIEIEGIIFYNPPPINHLIRQYDKVRKVPTGQGDDYTSGCLWDFTYFEQN